MVKDLTSASTEIKHGKCVIILDACGPNCGYDDNLYDLCDSKLLISKSVFHQLTKISSTLYNLCEGQNLHHVAVSLYSMY